MANSVFFDAELTIETDDEVGLDELCFVRTSDFRMLPGAMIEGTPVEFVRMVPTLRGAADRSPYAKRCAARRVHGGVALCSPRNSTFAVVVPAARAAQLADEIERLFGYECPVCHAQDEHRVRCMRCEQRGFMLSSASVVRARSRRVCSGCQCEIDRDVCHCGESLNGPSHYGEGSHAFVPSGCSCYLLRRAEVRRVTASAADGGLLAERALTKGGA